MAPPKNYDLSEAERLLRRAASMLDEADAITSPTVRLAAVDAAKAEARRLMQLVENHLRKAS